MLIYILLSVSACAAPASSETTAPLVGQTEKVYTLASENTRICGLAADERSPEAPRLLVLDQSGKIFTYQLHQDPEKGIDDLKLVHAVDLPKGNDGAPPASPRGLACAQEGGQDVVYFLNWDDSEEDCKSQLWRLGLDDGTSACVDLSLYPLRIGDREVLDLACDDGKLLIAFDGSGYTSHNLRVQRGIVQFAWDGADRRKLAFVRHLPDAGTSPSRGIAWMELGGARYFWATVGGDHVYCADARTGRGLFHLDRPVSTAKGGPCSGLCFAAGALWVPESVTGPDRLHRVNVTRNLDAFYEGPRILRHLVMTVETEPEADSGEPGKAYHYYSRPCAYRQLHNQGVWVETEKVVDVSGAPNATIDSFTYDPAGDASSQQQMSRVEYPGAPGTACSSRYEIDLWTNAYRKFVYPHRANRNTDALDGTDYLADDPDLFNLNDTATYDAFFERVKAHVERKYGTEADLKNPYWAARNALEYIQDCYYYPNRAKRKPAAVDYERKHYDANPGNLKIELSDRAYDKSQIIACSGTSVMLAGAMRYLGIPARWLGTGTEQDAEGWDTNANGLLDAGETAPCTNGHRYTQVWLGSHYGWICFDATPSKPEFNDYDPPPPPRPQWRYMNRAAAGHLRDKRIVFNIGSALLRPLYRDFEYDAELAIDNNCGGDQRYNLQGRFDKPGSWKLARHNIAVKNTCFIEEVTISGPRDRTRVAWKPKGDWNRIPGATISLYLEQVDRDTREPKTVATLAEAIPYDSRTALVDLSHHSGERFRITLRRDGDSETGGHSKTFEIE